MRARIPIRSVKSLRYLLVLAYKPEHVPIESRGFNDETIAAARVLQHDLAAIAQEDEFVAFSGELEFLAVGRSVDTRVIRRVLHFIKRRRSRRVRQRFVRE